MAIPELKTASVVKRYAGNPVLSADDVPYAGTLVFNAGVTKWQGRYVMLFRNEVCNEKGQVIDRNLGLALSDDGIAWTVKDAPIDAVEDHPLRRFYDPRLTVLDGRVYLCFATGLRGTRGGLAVTDDFENWEVLNISVPDNRNMVVFPERIDGKIVRLERPFAGYLRPNDRFDMWLARSPDGVYWGEADLVLTADALPWTNNKIGPGPPPVKTDKGWLTLLHAVDRREGRAWGWSRDWDKRYTVGICLLDLEDPAHVIGYSRAPLMAPEEEYPYEVEGYRGYVQFPTGAILEDDGELKIYYGAADTVMALATARVDDLLALCESCEA